MLVIPCHDVNALTRTTSVLCQSAEEACLRSRLSDRRSDFRVAEEISMESLILAQDERWRRA